MASREDDPKLDAALTALAGTAEPPPGDDDARWAKRVASRVSTFPAPSRRDLDPLFEAPFPDGFVDVTPAGHRDFDHAPIAADDHANAASAADLGDSGWEGSMSDRDSRPPNSLAALSGLTRSGPASNPDAMEGAAKGDDSGLINLKAMTEPPPEEVAAAAEPEPVVAAAPVDARPAKTAAAGPSAISGGKIPVASTASANAPPASSTQASAVSAPAQPAAGNKKSSAVVWLGLAGVAAAAAAAFMFVGPMARKSEEPASAQPAAAPPPVEKKAADEKVAVKEPPAANATAAPEPQQGADPALDPAQPPAGTAAGKPLAPSKAGSMDTKALAPTPAPSAKPTTTAAEAPKTNPAGGSLDDVLGIGKDQPTAKKVETDNLPDKPESMDVRSAINSKLSGGNACVKGLEGPSNVSVTFGPAGTVSGVVVTSGPAKGTGAEACIKNAFSGAKVPASKKGASGSATLVP